MSDDRINEVLAAELTLTQTLAALGMTHRPAPAPSRRKEVLSDGVVVGIFNADECWDWLRDGCPTQPEAVVQ
jgi:hypothetical protein